MKHLFYYTSVSALCTKGQEMIQKIKSTLQVFAEHKDEISVFWYQDPHVQEFLSRDSELFAKYQALLVFFRDEVCGTIESDGEEDRIFRREIGTTPFSEITPTPTESRGIKGCDAYYGSPGYLAECFVEAGKPVMIQDPMIGTEERNVF